MTTLLLIEKGELLIVCDGCQARTGLSLPMATFEFTAHLLAFDADHRFCPERPVKDCQYAGAGYGTCTHERNLAPNCGLEVCPLN